MTPTIVRVDQVAPTRWRNGGGLTRELLAWPDPQQWIVRISVADIHQSGPFSDFPGVDRWFAVLSGGAVRLETTGAPARELATSRATLHEFSGDAATQCSMVGSATRDFNIMLRRARGRLEQRPLVQQPLLESTAAAVALFAVQPLTLAGAGDVGCTLPGMALAWWPNPRRELLALRAMATDVRGWWLEVHTRP